MSYDDTMEQDDDFIKITCREGSEFMEFPKESDGSILLSTIQAQFPRAIGLKYKGSSGAWRAIREADNILDAPKGGWGERIYCLTVSETNKRRIGDTFDNGGTERKIVHVNPLLQDMAVIGLPYKTTDEELKDYFESNYGELAYSEVKFDRATGKSRGFGFIRFKEEASAKEAVNAEHYMEGRKVEVRQKKDKPMKMFIGRLPHGTTTQDLEAYFSQYGQLTDTYIPTPFRNFAFITYASTEDGKSCMRDSHVLGGARLNVMERNQDKDKAPRNEDQYQQQQYQHQQQQQQRFGNNANSMFSGGYNTKYNPKEVHGHMDYQNGMGHQAKSTDMGHQGKPTDMDSDLKNMLFQFLASQK